MTLRKKRLIDRRTSVRVLFENSESVLAQFVLNGVTVEGHVGSLGKNGFTVLCQGKVSSLEPMREATKVDVVLNCASLKRSISLHGLHLKRMADKHDGGFVVHFDAPDAQAKSALWIFLNEVDQPGQASLTRQRMEEDDQHKIPGRGHYTEGSRQERVQFIRQRSGRPLERLDHIDLIPDRLSSNIENLVGSVEIPVGIAGPLQFAGESAKGIFYAPFATTEGALVASATRGATAMTRSGGVTTRVFKQQMMRVPLFRFSNLAGSFIFTQWLLDFHEEIRAQTRKVSRYANLVELDPIVNGASVHVRFIYETGDAAGQNMTTTCTWHACMWILEQLKAIPGLNVEHFIIESNVSGDKKVNFMSFVKGRGIRVAAECFLHEEDLQKVLKVKSQELEYAFHLLSQGAHNNGMVGVNINVANTIAAIFAATGQDIACVHESSLAVLNVECVEGGIYASMLLPSLIIGTVGGGTSLPDQNQFLQMIGCNGPNNVNKLAEIIAGFCLALDLSTLAALATGQFAMAHEKLGRNRPVSNLSQAEITAAFLQKVLSKGPKILPGTVQDLQALSTSEDSSSIITELTSRRLMKFMGLFPYRLTMNDQSTQEVMIKVKPMDSEVNLMMNTVASMCHPVLAKAYRKHFQHVGFVQCHRRELAIFQQTDPRFLEHAPHCYGTMEDASREIYLLALENIGGISHMNTVNHPNVWDKPAVEAVVQGLAQLHAIWWKREAELAKKDWIGTIPRADLVTNMSELWYSLGIHAAKEFNDWYDQDMLEFNGHLVNSLPTWWEQLDRMPKTLIHNDFNPRNIGLRKQGDRYKLCAYDWELATLHVPQHDLAEFLIFVLNHDCSLQEVENWVEMHRQALMQATGDQIPQDQWRRGFVFCLMDLTINRIPMYIMAHTLHHYKFIKRVSLTCRHLLRITEGWL